MLMLHGFPDTAHTWDHLRPLIAARGYRAVSPFMRGGYHPTAVPAADPGQETLARDVLALISALGGLPRPCSSVTTGGVPRRSTVRRR